jgi:hypothetical protein
MLRGSRLFLPLIAAALAGAAMADDRAALPHDEHYPAAYLHKAGLDEARTAEALRMARLMRGHEGDEKMRELYTSTDPDGWLRLGSHSFLDRVFPGAMFYMTSPAASPDAPGIRVFVAIRDGKYYFLPGDVCRLFYDCGMRFDDDDMPNWLRAIAIIQSIGPVEPDTCRRLPNGDAVYELPFQERWPRAWSLVYRGDMPLLPALEIESVRLDTGAVDATLEWIRGKVHQARIWVRRDGKKDSVEVGIGPQKTDGKLVRCPTGADWGGIAEPQSSYATLFRSSTPAGRFPPRVCTGCPPVVDRRRMFSRLSTWNLSQRRRDCTPSCRARCRACSTVGSWSRKHGRWAFRAWSATWPTGGSR